MPSVDVMIEEGFEDLSEKVGAVVCLAETLGNLHRRVACMAPEANVRAIEVAAILGVLTGLLEDVSSDLIGFEGALRAALGLEAE